jgi:hypothetical protein
MMHFIHKYIGLKPSKTAKEDEKDDFSRFFYDAKSAEKSKVIKEVMREATAEQQAVIKRYKEKQHAH